MSSTLDPANLTPSEPNAVPKGHDVKTLGPSDSSDSGSDMAGAQPVGADALPLERGTNEDGASMGAGLDLDDNSDRYGTGEREAAAEKPGFADEDIDTDRVVNGREAGVGRGLDEAEEARLGIADEDLEEPDVNPRDVKQQKSSRHRAKV